MDYSPFYLKNYHQRPGKKPKPEKSRYMPPAAGGYSSERNAAAYCETEGDGRSRKDERHREAQEYRYETAADIAESPGSASGRREAPTSGHGGNEPIDAFIRRENSPKKKKDKTGLFVTLILLLSFAVVVFATEFFSGGLLLTELKAAVNPNVDTRFYYLVSAPCGTEISARSQAESVRTMGGAGYIYRKDSQYYVVIATYFDKKTAENVQKKNNDTAVLELTAEKPDETSLGANERTLTEKARRLIKSSLDQLFEYTVQLDSASRGFSDISGGLQSIRNSMLYLKEEVTGSALPKEIKNRYILMIDPVFGGLDAVLTATGSDSAAAMLRNIIASTVCVYCL